MRERGMEGIYKIDKGTDSLHRILKIINEWGKKIGHLS